MKSFYFEWSLIAVDYSQGDLVTSAKGKEMQQQLWGEIVDALKVKTPAVESLASEKL